MGGNRATGTVWIDGEMIAEDVEIKFELEAVPLTKQYRTEKRKARVGERILITNAGITLGYYTNGDVFTVAKDLGRFGVDIKENQNYPYISDDEYEVIVEETQSTPSIAARVTELEAKVAALETQLADYDLKPKYRGIKLREEIAKTANSRRADVIKQARAFVEEHTKHNGKSAAGSGVLVGYYVTKPEFIVNTEKRTVVVLMKGVGSGKIYAKGIAKCAPGDVFNADIGKAIALARALGVKVPAEFLNAPKPDSVVVGMRVRGSKTSENAFYRKTRTFTLTKPREDGWAYSEKYALSDGDWITEAEIGLIIDDTEAQY